MKITQVVLNRFYRGMRIDAQGFQRHSFNDGWNLEHQMLCYKEHSFVGRVHREMFGGDFTEQMTLTDALKIQNRM